MEDKQTRKGKDKKIALEEVNILIFFFSQLQIRIKERTFHKIKHNNYPY